MGLNWISDNTARLWDLSNPGSSPRVLSGHKGVICSVALTPDGKWALTGSYDCTAQSGILEILEVVLVFFQGIPTGISSVALTPDGKWALTGSDDSTARLWELFLTCLLLKFKKLLEHMKKQPEKMMDHECKEYAG